MNWTNFAMMAVPGVVFLLMLHNFILYQEGPIETLGDIIEAIADKPSK